MRRMLRRSLERYSALRHHPWLARFGPALQHPRIWQLHRQSVPLGAAIGSFFAFAVPLGQIPLAALTAVLLRANVPAAALFTFITNPFTFGPVYYLAYQLGAWLLNVRGRVVREADLALPDMASGHAFADWWRTLGEYGLPLLLGLGLFALCVPPLVYLCLRLLWRLQVLQAWQARRQARIRGRQ
jgi:uncharacterized protein (DUF2062 family)